MEIRTPFIAILVLGILILIYLRKTLPQLYSSRIFFVFLILATINVLCEIFESMVFLRLGDGYSDLRKLSQVLYILTLLGCSYIFMLYVYSKTTVTKYVGVVTAFAMALPLIVGGVCSFFLDVTFNKNNAGHYYNSGPLVSVAYIIGFIYVMVSLISVVVFRKRLGKDESFAISVCLFMWIALAACQFFVKGTQVSAIAMMLMSLVVFLVIENPKELFEKSMPIVKSSDSFARYLTEIIEQKKKFYILSVIFTGKSNVLNSAERKELKDMQRTVADSGQKMLGTSAYLSHWNTLSFIEKQPSKVEEFMNFINNYKAGGGNYKLTFSLVEIPKCTDKADETLQIMSYVSEEYVFTQSSPNIVIDENIVDSMVYRNDVESIVRQAVRDKAFDVYYQPILNVEDGSFSSAEALVRLRRPESENYISPDVFIPIAEKCGLIQEIDDLVFEKVCSFISRENLSSFGLKTMEVNLSGNEVVDYRAYDRLIQKMEKYSIPPKFINFEITETAYINNDEAFKENVRKLKEMGSTFSMDDFGSGYSNLLELLKMDYILVKMDKEFVWNCLDSSKPENMKMLRYTIDFLKEYGLHILAEGVETLDQAEILVENGVEYLQGFYYSRPISEKDYIEFLKVQKGLVDVNLKGDLR